MTLCTFYNIWHASRSSKAVDLGYANETQFEVYVADQYNIRRSTLPRKHLATIRNKDLIAETERIASEVHPAWNNCIVTGKQIGRAHV